MMHVLLSSLMLLNTSGPESLRLGEDDIDLDALTTYSLKFDPAAAQADSQGPAGEEPAATSAHVFGETGSTSWLVIAAAGTDLEDDQLGRVGVGISHFIADDFSIDVDLNAAGFWQSGDDAFGANLNLLLRWHFWRADDRSWTVYMDGGAGMLLTSHDVPNHGSSFNFTPQFGLGASWDIGDDRRLYVGGRWFHVSNARLYESNPGNDYALAYVMLGWPF